VIIGQQQLTGCAGLGEPLRSSDPQIANAVNVAARQGDEIALADPMGLYLGKPVTAGMVAPDGADAGRFWKIERGDAEHTLRARFEVPRRAATRSATSRSRVGRSSSGRRWRSACRCGSRCS
jgi:hypothetical protein